MLILVNLIWFTCIGYCR